MQIISFFLCLSRISRNEYGSAVIWWRFVTILTDQFLHLTSQMGMDFPAFSSIVLACMTMKPSFMCCTLSMVNISPAVSTSMGSTSSAFRIPWEPLSGTGFSDSTGCTSLKMEVEPTVVLGQMEFLWPWTLRLRVPAPPSSKANSHLSQTYMPALKIFPRIQGGGVLSSR